MTHHHPIYPVSSRSEFDAADAGAGVAAEPERALVHCEAVQFGGGNVDFVEDLAGVRIEAVYLLHGAIGAPDGFAVPCDAVGSRAGARVNTVRL